MCENHNLCIVNGRTVGDFEGKYTFYNSLGNSSIDLTLVDFDYLPKILSFKVHPPNEFSHHCKIETKLSCQVRMFKEPTDDSISKAQFNKFILEGDIFKQKFIDAMCTTAFVEKKISHFKQKLYINS